MFREINQEILVKKPVREVFDALLRPSMIKKWWGASTAIVLAKEGGTYAVAWGEDEDEPDYLSISTIKKLDAPSNLVLTDFQYHSKEGSLPFDAEMDTRFDLEPQEYFTRLKVRQTGFPQGESADAFYAGCVKGWHDTLNAFKETLEGAPSAIGTSD